MGASFRLDVYASLILLRALPGLVSIGFSLHRNVLAAGIALVLAVWSDVALSFAARKRGWQKQAAHTQLDGFVDFTCFIWAPVQFGLSQSDRAWVLCGALAFVLSGIFRLARFNVEGLVGGGYRGLPVTYNGYFFPLAALGLNYISTLNADLVYVVLFGALAVLMSTSRFTVPEL